MKAFVFKVSCCLLIGLAAVGIARAEPLGSAITYQGELLVEGNPANAIHEFQFELFDAAANGSSVAGVLEQSIEVSDGIFSAVLDFGAAAFDGDARWLEVRVRAPGEPAYTTLSPRQLVTAAPYALHAETVAMDAVAGAEIADGSITGVDIAGGAVGSTQIQNNSILDVDIASGAVGGAEIKSDEVQLRVTGTCAPGTQITAINADGSVQCDGSVGYSHIIVVSKSGGDFTSVTAAMTAIGSDPAYPAASATNRYLVWVGPGVYTDEDVDMQPFVDIQGSGEGVTVLTSEGGTGGISPDSATLVGTDNAELRDITVEIVGADANVWTHAIYTAGASRLTNVTANARGGGRPRGIMVASGGSPILVDISVSATEGADSNLALDVVSSTVIVDGLFALADGGTDAKAIFINNASSEARLENVTAVAGGSTRQAYALETVFSDTTISGLDASVASEASFNRAVQCQTDGRRMRLFDSDLAVESDTAPGSSQSTLGIAAFGCNMEVRNVTIDVVSLQETSAYGFYHQNTTAANEAELIVSNLEARVRSTKGFSRGFETFSSGTAGDTRGRITDINLSSNGGAPTLNSHGILNNSPGPLRYRDLTIAVSGQANFLYGIQSQGEGPRFDDVVIDAEGEAEATVFGIEIFGDRSGVSNARVRAVNIATGEFHDAVGIKANGADDVEFTNITAYAEAETNVWGADMVGSTTRLARVNARAVGVPGDFIYGLRCFGGSTDVRGSGFDAGSGVTVSYGLFSNGCSGTVYRTDLVGATYGLYTFTTTADTTDVRNSVISGVTSSVRTLGDSEVTIVASSLDGGAGSSGSPSDSQECTAVTFNSGGGESFQAGTSDPCP